MFINKMLTLIKSGKSLDFNDLRSGFLELPTKPKFNRERNLIMLKRETFHRNKLSTSYQQARSASFASQ